MIKVNICVSQNDEIEGYHNITTNQVSALVNGSVDDIMFACMDDVGIEDRARLIAEILSKIKHGGSATFKFADVFAMGRDMYMGTISTKSLSDLICKKQSLGYESDILETVDRFPQFSIKNRYNNNQNIVLTVTKDLSNNA